MKKFSLLFLALLLTSALAEARKPLRERREAHQEKRIQNGIQQGQINEQEAAHLGKQQERIDAAEDNAESDGKVTAREKAKINHMQNRANRNIFRARHNKK